MDPSIESPVETPKKKMINGAAGCTTDVEGGVGVSKGGENEFVGPADSVKTTIIPFDTPGFCHRCHVTLDMLEDGRGGLWIVPHGNGKVFVDGNGLCSDCEQSVETDLNWGRSRRISDEETSWSSDEVTSSTPSKKKQRRS